MSDQDQIEMRIRLAKLEMEHSDYGHAIDALTSTGAETLCIQRFKKKKLALKDEINKLHSLVMPNIIA